MSEVQNWPLIQSIIWIVITLFSYVLVLKIFTFLGGNLIFHPIVTGAMLVVGLCFWADLPLVDYADYVSPMSWFLGPITVALAVPLYQQIKVIVESGWQSLLVIVCGGALAPVFCLLLLYLGDFSTHIQFSTLTKSITTPLALDTATLIGAVPELVAAVVVVTGLTGALLGSIVFKLLQCQDHRVKGITLGTVAHAIGTAQALQISDKAGAYSTMALCINGIITAIVLPTMFYFFGG